MSPPPRERDALTIDLLDDPADARRALAFLASAAAAADAPLVDETEEARLDRLASGARDPGWYPLLARRAGMPLGYAGVVLPGGPGGTARGDVAVDRDHPGFTDTTAALFAALRRLVAERAGAGRLCLWLRHATDADVAAAAGAGNRVDRRLEVLGRDTSQPVPPPHLPDNVRVRAFHPGDAGEVVALLAAAYAGTPEESWDRDRFEARRRLDWFAPDDLLVAEDEDGGLAGLHWTKRRPDGRGEVYNLAVHPTRHGSGLGRALLRAGLRHLHGRGCEEVILWVDQANRAAVGLYTAEGFTRRWVDLALTPTA
jgi:mycothiol synthase